MTKPQKDWAVNVWAEEVHHLALDKGWWDAQRKEGTTTLDPDLVKEAVAAKLNLIHDEISEGSTEARVRRYDTYWVLDVPGWAERGLVSLHTLRVMIFRAYAEDRAAQECLQALCWRIGVTAHLDKMSRLGFLEHVVQQLCLLHKPEGFGIEIVDALIRCLDLLHALGYSTEELMRMKHTYNETRPYRHGNKAF
jgi:hypothetical protein